MMWKAVMMIKMNTPCSWVVENLSPTFSYLLLFILSRVFRSMFRPLFRLLALVWLCLYLNLCANGTFFIAFVILSPICVF